MLAVKLATPSVQADTRKRHRSLSGLHAVLSDGSVVALAVERKADVRTEDDADIQRLISASRAKVHVVGSRER